MLLGAQDGNVYEALYEAAKQSELNQRDPFLGYNDVVRRHLDLELLQEESERLRSRM